MIEIIGEDFILRLYALASLRENKVLANKKCLTVCTMIYGFFLMN